jgi:hypothetical protein
MRVDQPHADEISFLGKSQGPGSPAGQFLRRFCTEWRTMGRTKGVAIPWLVGGLLSAFACSSGGGGSARPAVEPGMFGGGGTSATPAGSATGQAGQPGQGGIGGGAAGAVGASVGAAASAAPGSAQGGAADAGGQPNARTVAGPPPLDDGRAVLRRLSRGEFTNTMRDLLGTSLALGVALPADDSLDGFDG